MESANWILSCFISSVFENWYHSKLFLSHTRASPDGLCSTEYGCDGISNLPASPYCHTACTLLSVSIVEGRPLDFRVEQTVYLNADYRLPYQFHCLAAAQPAMQIFLSRRRDRICKFIGRGGKKRGNNGYVRLLDSTRNSATIYELRLPPYLPFVRVVNFQCLFLSIRKLYSISHESACVSNKIFIFSSAFSRTFISESCATVICNLSARFSIRLNI